MLFVPARYSVNIAKYGVGLASLFDSYHFHLTGKLRPLNKSNPMRLVLDLAGRDIVVVGTGLVCQVLFSADASRALGKQPIMFSIYTLWGTCMSKFSDWRVLYRPDEACSWIVGVDVKQLE